ncbi:Hypothetical protein LOCK908_0923 [Lacticaseibacillus rhamnosus LOCK908]|nr:hypothetical protein LRHK_884 [Lacticaseibacillus rhamnosus ATCC 8530]AGP73568.1 Hypothetical protein LOCK908_0923 [Lacticaseibacillus rhamnosus LOCK908]
MQHNIKKARIQGEPFRLFEFEFYLEKGNLILVPITAAAAVPNEWLVG